MSKAVAFISAVVFHKTEYSLTPVIRKCSTYGQFFSKGSPVFKSSSETRLIHSNIYNLHNFFQHQQILCPSLIYNFTHQQINRFSSVPACIPMSRKKKKRERKEVSHSKSHEKSGKIKKNRSHTTKSSTKKDNDWYLLSKKQHKKSKKKRKSSKRNSSPHFPTYSFGNRKRKMNLEHRELSNNDEAHSLLEEAFDACCQVEPNRRSETSRDVRVGESSFSKKLNDLLLRDAGKINLHSENYSRNTEYEERNVNEHQGNVHSYEDGCQDSWSRSDRKANLVRSALRTYRKEEFLPGSQDSEQESWQSMEVKYKFKVLSYNVLSQQLLMSNPRLYRHHNPAHLNWSYRAPRLMDEFKNIDADIICLQEVEAGHIPFYNELEKCGYKGIHKKRTGDKNDGCAIYFKTARFTLIDYTTVEFQQPEASVLDRDNIGLVVKLHPVGWDKFPLVVSTTHLLYNPKRHDVKLAQMQVLLTEIERFAYNSKFAYFTYHPIILTGDFNLQPYTSVYQLLLSGSLRYDILDRKFLQMDVPSHFHMGKSLLSSRLGITDSCQHYKILKVRELEDANGFVGSAKVQERLIGIQNSDRNVHVSGIQVPDEDRYRFGSGVLSHGFSFKSVYNHADSESREPEATTHHDEWVTVDYMLYTNKHLLRDEMHRSTFYKRGVRSSGIQLYNILPDFMKSMNERDFRAQLKIDFSKSAFYSKEEPLKNVSSNRDQLQLVNRMRLPTVTECEKLGRIPNEACPSDHIPLVANFYLRLRKTDRHYDDRSNTRRKK